MFKRSRLSHICFDVKDIEKSVKFYNHLYGTQSSEIVTFPIEEGTGVVKMAFIDFEEVAIELAEHHLPPSWGDTPLLTGSGFHHIGIEASDFDETLSRLERQGINPLPKFPMKTPHGRVAFLNPEQTGGILYELAEKKGPANG